IISKIYLNPIRHQISDVGGIIILSDFTYGVLSGIASSLLFSLNTVITRRGVYEGNVFEAVAYATLFGIPMFFTSAYLAGEIGFLLNPKIEFIMIFIMAGILHFILGRYLYYKSIHLSGATIATPIVTLTQVFAVIFAFILLGEEVDILKGIGIILSLSGITYISLSHLREVRYIKGILIGLSTTLVFAASTNLVRYGLTIAPYPHTGLFISYLASAPTLISFKIHKDRISNVDSETRKYLIYSGVTVNLGQMFRYIALAFIGVTVLSPLYGIMPIEVLLLSYLIIRRYERLTKEVIISNIIVSIGVLLVILSGYV
ncbi:TPA: EamA family transporter, partial [Candidatus Geothermarchaeota archaeon]|nr:EamA family transporter [Candidatus Geothermarchaeota archaeon]